MYYSRVNLVPNLDTPKRIAPMPSWPGPTTAIELAVAGVREDPPFAVGFDFPDGSSMMLEYQLERSPDAPPEMYNTVGEPPLLSVLVLDRGAGLVTRYGMTARVAPHQAEKALQEIQKVIGVEKPLGIVAQGLNPRTSRRRYWWKLEA